MSSSQKVNDKQLLSDIHAIALELRDGMTRNGQKLDEVHREVSRTSVVVDALRDQLRTVEHAVRDRPQWLVVVALAAMIGVSLVMHALRLLG